MKALLTKIQGKTLHGEQKVSENRGISNQNFDHRIVHGLIIEKLISFNKLNQEKPSEAPSFTYDTVTTTRKRYSCFAGNIMYENKIIKRDYMYTFWQYKKDIL